MRRIGLIATFVALLLGAFGPQAAPLSAAPQSFTAAGANPAAIQATVDQMRTALGALNAPGIGSLGAGRREINWDGTPDNFSAPNNLPANFFNSNSPRGVEFSTPGTGVQVSMDDDTVADPDPDQVRFENLFAGYSTTFTTFSAQRLFTSLGSNVLVIDFFVPGTNIPATVNGFGAVFTDVDAAETTKIEFLDGDGAVIGSVSAPAADGGLSFAGMILDEGVEAWQVRITSGNTALGLYADGSGYDVVAMDDFIYAEPIPAFDETIFALTTTNAIVSFNASTPAITTAPVAITGLQAGENILGIDRRPADGKIYGLGSTSRIYWIDPWTGVATAVGTGPFTPALSGTSFGFDFNPVVDRIRVVSNTGQNLRIHPVTGAVAGTDTPLNPGTPSAVGAAYANNRAGTQTTTLYVIDSASDTLSIQNPPNGGTLVPVGPLGVDTEVDAGFDIAGQSGRAYAVLDPAGATNSQLFLVDLATGSATLVGRVGDGTLSIRGIAGPAEFRANLPLVVKAP